MKVKSNTGYSANTAKNYILPETEVILLSTELKEQYKWKDGKPTDEVVGYKILCGIANDCFNVKLPHKIKLPAFGSKIEFKGLEACEVNNNVYFRAKEIKEV